MSQETAQWLNTQTLIGYTAKRGQAWHYRQSAQGAESNHYEGAIPVGDVHRRLFHWEHAEGDVSSTVITADGVSTITDPTRKAIVRPVGTFGPQDRGAILGLFKSGYQVHAFGEWLLDEVANILDADLHIGSAGLLKGGAVAWVQIEMADTISTPEGVDFRPFLTAATSVDGSLSTTYQTGAQVVVCDNTLAAAMGAKDGDRVKIRHSRNSLGRITEVREALNIVHGTADAFAAEVAQLTATEVTGAQWQAFLDAIAPQPVAGSAKTTRAASLADRKRDELNTLWRSDLRVSPWQGTAFGVLQAVNTHAHHYGTVKGMTRPERNMTRMVEGKWAALDADTMATLRKVLATV